MSAGTETLPPPNNPDDFESLCLDLWKDIWQDPGALKNGRSGYPQSGVDVYGQPDGHWAGVQCKQKDGQLRRKVTVKELEHEVCEALTFKPELTAFILATTGPADVKVQQRARELTDEHRAKGLFTVEVWSWEKIWHELYGRRELLKRIQPIYWPTIGLKPEVGKRTFTTIITILVAFIAVIKTVSFLFGKEVAGYVGGALTVLCVAFYFGVLKLRFERIPDSQVKIIAVPKLSWYSLFGSVCLFVGSQVAIGLLSGAIQAIWMIHSDPAMVDAMMVLHLPGRSIVVPAAPFAIARRMMTSSMLVKILELSYIVGGYCVGKYTRSGPHAFTYAILGSFLFAVLSTTFGAVFSDFLVALSGLNWPDFQITRQVIANWGVNWFFFVFCAYLGASLAEPVTPRRSVTVSKSSVNTSSSNNG